MFSLLKWNKRKVIMLIVALLLIGLGIWFWMGRVDAKIIGKEATIKRVVFGTEKTENAYLSLPYNSDSQKYLYSNVMVDLNKDGKFASYQTDGKTQEEWVTQNMSTRVFKSEGANFDFQLVDLNSETRQNFSVKVILTKDKLKNWDGKEKRASAYQTTTVPSIDTDDASTLFSPSTELSGKTGFRDDLIAPAFAQNKTAPNTPPVSNEDLQKELDDQTKAEILKRLNPINPTPTPTATEKTIQTLGKEFDIFNSDVPDITQGKNECAPTSVANSLLWLSKKNKFTDKMPKTQADLLGELKSDLKWGVDHGVYDEDFITGKKAFATRHGLDIEVHRINVKDYDLNIVAKIAQELQKGQDVELGIEYWKKQDDGKWKLMGGHWVTAVGARGERDGTQTIDIHDPASPGPSSLDSYKVNGANIIDYRYQGDSFTYIQYAVAESPITPPTVTPSNSSTPITPTPTATTTSSPRKSGTTTSSPSTSASPSVTTSSNSSPTSSSSSTPTSTTPTFSGYYDKFFGDEVTTFGVKITPTDLGGKTFNGLEINHNGQGLPAPYGSNTNLNLTGYDNSGWSCVCTGDKYRCTGSNAMQANVKTVWSLWFNGDIAPPSSLNIDLLTDGTVTASTTLNYQ